MKKEFTNETGLGKIIIKLNSQADCFVFERPLAFSWYDGEGSVARFFSVMPFSREYRNLIVNSIQEITNSSVTDLNEILIAVHPLLNMLETGKYEISFEEFKPANGTFYWHLVNTQSLVENYYDFGDNIEALASTQPFTSINEERI